LDGGGFMTHEKSSGKKKGVWKNISEAPIPGSRLSTLNLKQNESVHRNREGLAGGGDRGRASNPKGATKHKRKAEKGQGHKRDCASAWTTAKTRSRLPDSVKSIYILKRRRP